MGRDWITPEAGRRLAELSAELHRQVGLLIGRDGRVTHVILGDARGLTIPRLARDRTGPARLRGLRLVHTHLAGEPLSRDDLADLALLRLDLMAAITLTPEGLPDRVHLAHLDAAAEAEAGPPVALLPPARFHELTLDAAALAAEVEQALARRARAQAVAGGEAALLVGCFPPRAAAEAAMEELAALCRACGLTPLERVVQRRPQPDPRTVLGRGKMVEVVTAALHRGATTLVFHGDLTPAQAKAVTALSDLKVLDRTQVILDIFARRAGTREAKLRVELAQLTYLKPRLVGLFPQLSRLGGGIGTRGPGETKLEVDRRRIDGRIAQLHRQLEALAQGERLRRRRRRRAHLPVVSIVGYTNAGKTTLLNRLTGSRLEAADRPFATLDTASRRLRFPEEREVLLTDTVGFIRDLPPALVGAFRATLAELAEADLLLHVVDVSDPEFRRHMEAVEQLLEELGCAAVPRLLVFNKVDRLEPGRAARLAAAWGAVACSALDRATLRPVARAIEAALFRRPEARPAARGLAARA
ncbi:MAG: GTPase HflX [Nitrospirae bacterium]|nr:MAG: GTPase HflX [Nitrospirota bacterium]